MISWYRGTKIEHMQNIKLRLPDYANDIKALKEDLDVPLCSNNLVYLSKGEGFEMVDRDILYSILNRDPKRADAYWFISVNTTDQPYQREYEVETFGTDFLFRVNLNLGFKVRQSVNVYMYQLVKELLASGELPPQNRKHSIYGPSPIGTFKFCMIRKMMPLEGDLSSFDSMLIHTKYYIRRIAGNPLRWFGLETSNVIVESVPLFLPRRQEESLTRVNRKDNGPKQ
jgi:KUP system potassium uptake protein